MLRLSRLAYCLIFLTAAYSIAEAQTSGVVLADHYDIFTDQDLGKSISSITLKSSGSRFTVTTSYDPNTIGDGELHGRSGEILWRNANGGSDGSRTEFTVDSDGSWRARSIRPGSEDFNFIARPQAGSPSQQALAASPPSPATAAVALSAVGDTTAMTPMAILQAYREKVQAAMRAGNYAEANRLTNEWRQAMQANADTRDPAKMTPDQLRAYRIKNAKAYSAGVASMPGLAGDVNRMMAAADLAEAQEDYPAALKDYLAVDAIAADIDAAFDQHQSDPDYRLLPHLLAVAQMHTADYYYEGLGVPRDYRKAAKWYSAAEPVGDSSLAFMSANGLGVPRDLAKARELLVSSRGPNNYLVRLMDHHIPLPKRERDITNDYIRQTLAKMQAEDDAAQAEEDAKLAKEILALVEAALSNAGAGDGGGQPSKSIIDLDKSANQTLCLGTFSSAAARLAFCGL